MSFDYSGFENLADDLITKFGRSVTLRRPTSTLDSTNTWEVTIANTDYTVTVAQTNFSASEINQKTILDGDRKYLLAGKDLSILPSPIDSIIDNGVEWSILDVEQIQPGGTDILYKIHARSGTERA